MVEGARVGEFSWALSLNVSFGLSRTDQKQNMHKKISQHFGCFRENHLDGCLKVETSV